MLDIQVCRSRLRVVSSLLGLMGRCIGIGGSGLGGEMRREGTKGDSLFPAGERGITTDGK
jgi:hypothetical protein